MSIFHDEIEIEDFEYDPDEEIYYYPCPCGDKFQIPKSDLLEGENIATCPSCSLYVRVIYEVSEFLNQQNEIEGLQENLKKLEIAK